MSRQPVLVRSRGGASNGQTMLLFDKCQTISCEVPCQGTDPPGVNGAVVNLIGMDGAVVILFGVEGCAGDSDRQAMPGGQDHLGLLPPQSESPPPKLHPSYLSGVTSSRRMPDSSVSPVTGTNSIRMLPSLAATPFTGWITNLLSLPEAA